jgi:hypothetical protein
MKNPFVHLQRKDSIEFVVGQRPMAQQGDGEIGMLEAKNNQNQFKIHSKKADEKNLGLNE